MRMHTVVHYYTTVISFVVYDVYTDLKFRDFVKQARSRHF